MGADAGVVLLLALVLLTAQVAPVGPELANDHGHALVNEHGLHLLQLLLHEALFAVGGIVLRTALMVAAAPIIEHLAPRLVLLHAPELPGGVVVYLNGQPVGGRVGELQVARGLLHRLANVGRRALHHQHTRGVLAARGAHGVDERLVVHDEVIHGRGLRRVLGVGLVQSGKEQVVVVVAEGLGYLRPDGCQHGLVLLHGGSVGVGNVVLQPTAVPVVVQHHVEAVVDAVVHHLLHAFHPVGVDGVVGGVADVAAHPRHGNAHGAEALRLDEVDDLLRGAGVLP